MAVPKKAAALLAGFAACVTLASLSAAQEPTIALETYVVEDAIVHFIEKSNVAALREGVIDRMELEVGMPVTKGKPIGYLHSEMAELTVKKAEIGARSQGPKLKAVAQRELAVTVVARNVRLNRNIPGSVSPEEVAKAEAEFKVSEATLVEAGEKTELDVAELKLAKRALEEHTIRAPFDGVILSRSKHPGESVRANEPVVQVGNLGKLRLKGFVNIEYAPSVKEGQIVEFTPRLEGKRPEALALEKKKFRGKISYVDPQYQAIGETAVQVSADFDNRGFEVHPGMKGRMTIYINSEAAGAPSTAPTVGARTAPNGVER